VRFDRLEISFFRNLQHVAVELAPGLNTFYGENGAGKTAILEAVHLLCRGRSFRTQNTQSLIQNGCDQLVVRAVMDDESRGPTSLAVSKDRHGKTQVRLNGEPEKRLSEIARLTPLQVMLPDIADLVFGGPSSRRAWIDWGTFHVKPRYLETLRHYLRAVRQRNVLLKDQADGRTLKPWNDEVARLGESVNAERVRYLDVLTPHFLDVLSELAPELSVQIRYQRGWGRDDDLGKLLGDLSQREVKYAATQWGPHRADVQLRVDGTPAGAILSRGQGKLVASAMQIAQAALLADTEHRRTVFLIDDAGAELDLAHNERFFSLLQRIGGQILATTTRHPNGGVSVTGSNGTEKMFHVKHGTVAVLPNDYSVPGSGETGVEQETQ
jgi:DNA replication and repair protein RecF